MAGGRKPVLTRKTMRKLVKAKRLGGTVNEQCAHAGVSPAAYYLWQAFAEEQERLGCTEFKAGSFEQLQMELLERLTRAEDEGTMQLVELVKRHAGKDWRAAAHLLAIRDPKRFSPRHRLEHTGAHGEPLKVTHDLLEMSPAQLAALTSGVVADDGSNGGNGADPDEVDDGD